MPDFEAPRIDAEFEAFLPVRTVQELADLERQLLEEGCLDPIRVWSEENIVVDGHHRLEICTRQKIPYEVKYLDFDSRDDIKKWMAFNQLAKRNLTDMQRAFYIGEQYLLEKQPHGGQAAGEGVASSATPSGMTAKKIAKKNKVSPRKVSTDAKFAAAVNAHEKAKPGSMKKILAGEAGKSKNKIIATAPLLCADCLRKGKMKDCKKCEELTSKKKKKPADSLFPEKKTKAKKPVEELDPFEVLMKTGTAFAALATKLIKAHGIRSERLLRYFTWCGLLEYTDGVPRFLPFVGTHAVIEATTRELTEKQVKDLYLGACGAIPYVPPLTKFRRAQKGKS